MSHIHFTYQPIWDADTGEFRYMQVGGWEGDGVFGNATLDDGRQLVCCPAGAEDACSPEPEHDFRVASEEEAAACVECTPVAAE